MMETHKSDIHQRVRRRTADRTPKMDMKETSFSTADVGKKGALHNQISSGDTGHTSIGDARSPTHMSKHTNGHTLSSTNNVSGDFTAATLPQTHITSIASYDGDFNDDQMPLLRSGSDVEDGEQAFLKVDFKAEAKPPSENMCIMALQVFFPYMIAGFGMVAAGLLLDIVQHWLVFREMSEIFIMVPALLGLKGNLEMTLASRLSTQANIGNMDSRKEMIKMIFGNLVLTQAQALVVGFLASAVAMIMGWIPQGKFNIHHGLLLCASSMLTACTASFVLGIIMVGVILLSRKCRINPDNVATPVAASLGDLITLYLLSLFSSLLYTAIVPYPWIAPTLLAMFAVLIPLWTYLSIKNPYTNEVIFTGWIPIIVAMFISSIGGFILKFAIKTFEGIATFQPVINGVGGNLVAVHSSRLTTALHTVSVPGRLPPGFLQGCPNIIWSFCGSTLSARAARVLLALVIPGQVTFMLIIGYLGTEHTTITPLFGTMYIITALLQVALLLYIANWMVHRLWVNGDDPDNFAIPYLTAIGDLLGTSLLALGFYSLRSLGDSFANVQGQ